MTFTLWIWTGLLVAITGAIWGFFVRLPKEDPYLGPAAMWLIHLIAAKLITLLIWLVYFIIL